MTPLRAARSASILPVARALVLIVLGMAAIAYPATASMATALVLAWILILSGITHLVFVWRTETPVTVLSRVVVGFAYAIAGYAMLQRPVWGMAALSLLISATLMLEGALALLVYFLEARASEWILFNGIVTVMLAAIIASPWPRPSFEAVGILVGINLLMSGVARLVTWMEDEPLDRFIES